MATRTFLALLLCTGFWMSADIGIARADPTSAQEKPRTSSPKPAFRYVITRNQTMKGIRYPEGGAVTSRGVDVLLDPKSFSEATLRQLVELLSKRFPDPDELSVNVYSNLDDLPTPEEAEYIPLPGSLIDLSTPKRAWALYRRNSEDEILHYHSKDRGGKFKTVNLRRKE